MHGWEQMGGNSLKFSELSQAVTPNFDFSAGKQAHDPNFILFYFSH